MNKWKLYKKIEGCRGFKILNNSLLIRSEKENYKLLEVDKKNFQVQWMLEEETLLFTTNENFIVFTDGKKETVVLSLHNKEALRKIPVVFSFDEMTISPRIIAGTTKKGICFHDIISNKFYENENNLSLELLIDDKLLCVNDNKEIIKLLSYSFSTLWQFDITQFGPYRERKIFANKEPEWRHREINRVYYHNNKIIVTLSRAIIALNPDNGELLWKIDFENYNPVDLLFDGNIAYSGRLIYFAIIDIEKGIKLFEKDYDPAYRFEVEGFKLSQIRYIGLTLHENHLWFTHEDKGHQFLLKANPQNGDILDGMLLETKFPTYPPLFDENRMYLLDQEGNLYIYERD